MHVDTESTRVKVITFFLIINHHTTDHSYSEVCSFLWKNSGSFNSISVTLSISLFLDYNRHSMVYQRKELCKCYDFTVVRIIVLCKLLMTGGNVANTCSYQKKVRNMVSWFGFFLVTVDCFALLVFQWERLVMPILLVECHSIHQGPWCVLQIHAEGSLMFLFLYFLCL